MINNGKIKAHRRKSKNRGGNRAVSPVIGTILMVAITVILAAIIGGVVLGIGSNVETTPQAGFAVTDSGGEVTVKLINIKNLDSFWLTGFTTTSSGTSNEVQLLSYESGNSDEVVLTQGPPTPPGPPGNPGNSPGNNPGNGQPPTNPGNQVPSNVCDMVGNVVKSNQANLQCNNNRIGIPKGKARVGSSITIDYSSQPSLEGREIHLIGRYKDSENVLMTFTIGG